MNKQKSPYQLIQLLKFFQFPQLIWNFNEQQKNTNSHPKNAITHRSDRQILNGGWRGFQIDIGIIGGGKRRSGGIEGGVGGEHERAIFGLLLFAVVVGVEGG